MVFFIFFDGGMIFMILAMLVLAAVGLLQQAFPVIVVLLWIVFGLAAGLNAFLTLFDEEANVFRRIINFIVNAVAFVFIGVVLASYISSLRDAMEAGGLNGLFEFILVGIFGAVDLMLMGAGLSYAGFYLVDSDATFPYGVRLGIAIAVLLVAAKLLFW